MDPGAGSLPLPFLIFDERLVLKWYNHAARVLFRLPAWAADGSGAGQREPIGISWFLRPAQMDSSDVVSRHVAMRDIRILLDQLADLSLRYAWGKGGELPYWTENPKDGCRTSHLAEVVVKRIPQQTSVLNNTSKLVNDFSIMFLRNISAVVSPALSGLGQISADSPSMDAMATPERIIDNLDQVFDFHGTGRFLPSLEGAKEMQDFIQNLPQIAFKSDKFGRTLFLNQQWYDFSGLSYEDSLSVEIWRNLFHPDEVDMVFEAFAHCISSGTPMNIMYRLFIKKQWRSLSASINPVKDADGQVEYLVGCITVVDDLARAKAEAIAEKEKILAILVAANLIVIQLDHNSIITVFEGPPSTAISSHLPDGCARVGTTLDVAWPDPVLHQAVQKMLTDVSPDSVEIIDFDSHNLRKGDALKSFRYRLVRVKHLIDRALEVYSIIIVANDRTSLFAAEREFQKANDDRAQLQASEQAATEASRLKTEFVTNMSHEIRTPIAGIININELLLSDESLLDEHRLLISKSLRAGEILLDLVGMVLDMGKVEAGKLEIECREFFLIDAVSDSGLFSLPATAKGVVFVEDIQPFYRGPLLGDRMRLRQVLANLLSNAVKFTKQGKIIFKVEMESEGEEICVFRFAVIDSGIGIKESVIPGLFSPFQQADTSTAREYGGSGLGLVISRKLVESMGGTISLTSVYGRGTTMAVRLPLQKAPTKPSGPALDIIEAVSGLAVGCDMSDMDPSEVRILVAEDNNLIREILFRSLRKLNFQVDVVADGTSAVEALSLRHYDVVLMDGQMSGKDGYEATAEIRRSTDTTIRNVKIIALTASACVGDRERCIDAGMDGYLAKPVRSHDLVAEIWLQLAAARTGPHKVYAVNTNGAAKAIVEEEEEEQGMDCA